jgi:hypothetical protein
LTQPTFQTVGLATPPGFNAEAYDAVHRHVSNLNTGPTNEWYLYGSAWNSVVYRYRAALEYEQRFTSLVGVSAAPPPEDRYAQEHALFGFIVSAASTVESFCFALHFLAGFAGHASFAIGSAADLRFYPSDVAGKLQGAFPGERLTLAIRAALGSSEYQTINALRMVLFHRGTPPRRFNVGDAPLPVAAMPANPLALPSLWRYEQPVDATRIRPLRNWLVSSLYELMEAAKEVVERHLVP